MAYVIRDMNTGHVLGNYPTEQDANEVLRMLLDEPNIPHWLQLLRVNGNEALIAAGSELSWRVFGGVAVRPLVALELHYLLMREAQMAIWFPQVTGEVFERWLAHQKAVATLTETFRDAEGVVAEAAFFDDLRQLSAEAYQLVERGKHQRLGDAQRVPDLADFDDLNHALRDWYLPVM